MTTPKNKTATPALPSNFEGVNFEGAFTELEGIVAQMESGQMTLERSLAAYQRGNDLLQFCQKSLAAVEQQVQILNARNQLAPFNAEETSN